MSHEPKVPDPKPIRFDPSGPLTGTLIPPPDKSISHRAAIIGAMAEGQTVVENFLDSDDTRSTLAAVAGLGAMVTPEPLDTVADRIVIDGVGPTGPKSLGRIDVGNAGTLLRLLPGWLAGWEGGLWRMDGDDSIRSRPVDRIAEPLSRMGARIEVTDGRFPPIRIDGERLHGIEYEMPVASAQVKSCLLLAGLRADGPTTVIEPHPTRDHTERMLEAAGAEIERQGPRVTVLPGNGLALESVSVPADISSAAFFIVAALIVPGSRIILEGVGINPTRTGVIEILTRMGARIEVEAAGSSGGEPIGRIEARSSDLAPVEVGGADIPLAIDELPLIALAAAFARGRTVIRDADELRKKESDRIATVVETLVSVGASAEATDDGMVVEGAGSIRGGEIDSHGDHRIAMLGAIAGLASMEGVAVGDFEAASVSYPRFEDDLESLLAVGR
jgi:3-phosphoshikimate 1-carboxyvinyltransferase